ncbi:MAG: pyruvate dehydrogenase [Chloroflexi bacterium]|nr:pyruvate dehydrogenase [Chloroflexota bacterium]
MSHPTTTSAPVTYDWRKLAHLAWVSRAMDEIEERELTPHGHVKYQFSASGHELGQLLLAQLLRQPFDAVSAYYRSRPLMLGIGLTPLESFLSGMAKPGGVSGGRDVGVVVNMLPRDGGPTVLPMAGDVGSQYTPAVGWAQAIRYRTEQLGEEALQQSMAVVCGGDGSVSTNGFWSSLTMATTLQLPVLFFIEDNGYAISVKSPLQTPGSNIAANLASFGGLAIWDGSGTEPAETADLVQAAVSHVRAGHGPALLRLTVPRLSGHSSVDNQAYKDEAERAEERARDPLSALYTYLVPSQFSQEEWDEIKAEAVAQVRQAAEQAIAAPEPNTADVTLYAFHDPQTIQKKGGLLPEGIVLPKGSDIPHPPSPSRLTMIEAIRKTLEVELKTNPRCVVFGEDVGFKGGVHAATVGLQKQFGEARVFDTSLSEEGIIGRAVGMALAGLLPVPEIQFRKYADPATEQINNCGSLRWRTDNNFAAPLVVRIPGGYRKIGDPWHSVTSEVTYTHAVGWQMAVPSNAADAVGLLRAALRGNDPVIFFEHRAMLDAAWARRPYPGDEYVLPFGRGHLVQTGTDLTVVTWGAMVERCELAAQAIGGRGNIELIDLRTLSPWDKELVLQSVRKTGKVLVVHEDIEFGGFGAEIAAVIAAEAFTDLDAPVARVAAPAVMVPFSQTLMEGVVPTVAKIQAKMEELLAF